MGKSFGALAYGAEPETLEDDFGRIRSEKVPEALICEIQSKVTGTVGNKPRGHVLKFLMYAACLVLVLGGLWAAGVFRLLAKPRGAVILKITRETSDALAADRELGSGSFSNPFLSRLSAEGLEFFEANGKTYMYYREIGPVFSFDGVSFTDTGLDAECQYYLSAKSEDGFGYFKGPFYSDHTEKGIYRVNLLTGKTEKYLETDDTVTSVAVNGSKVYYVTCTEEDSFIYYMKKSEYPDAKHSLKCVDTATGEITCLVSDADYTISQLNFHDGRLYFYSSVPDDEDTVQLCYIVSDVYLVKLPIKVPYSSNSIFFADGTICIRSYLSSSTETLGVGADGLDGRVRESVVAVDLYDPDGNMIGGDVASSRYIDGGGKKRSVIDESSRYFSGAILDGVTLYKGKIVSFTLYGVYLEDPATGTREKIIDRTDLMSDPENSLMDDPGRDCFNTVRLNYCRGISKTVYNGKLYIAVPVPVNEGTVYYRYRIAEYDDGALRLFDLNTEH